MSEEYPLWQETQLFNSALTPSSSEAHSPHSIPTHTINNAQEYSIHNALMTCTFPFRDTLIIRVNIVVCVVTFWTIQFYITPTITTGTMIYKQSIRSIIVNCCPNIFLLEHNDNYMVSSTQVRTNTNLE